MRPGSRPHLLRDTRTGLRRTSRSLGACAAACALVAACAAPMPPATIEDELYAEGSARAPERVRLFDAATAIQDEWTHLRVRGANHWQLVALDGRVAIGVTGRNAASGFARWVEIDVARCPQVEWTWRVDALQPTADLRSKAGDDVAAALFLLFGDPGMLSAPRRVPTLRYVWTTGAFEEGAVVPNPFLPDTVRNVVAEAGTARLGRWVTERRDVARDFEAAFGRPPPGPVQAVAIFTDNDQTGEPVQAFYAAAYAHCAP